MNKSTILKGLQQGRPLTFGLPFLKEIENPGYLRQQYHILLQAAKELSSQQIPSLSYQKFRLFWDTGDRQEYQEIYFDRRRRLLVYALLVWMEQGKSEYVHELEDILWAICQEGMWSLPAHFLDKEEKDLPLDKYPGNLDLFACETGFAIAETLRMCGGYLDGLCTGFAQKQLEERILMPFLDGQNFYRFEVMGNNWAAVCAGAIGCVGIVLLKDEEVLVNFLHRVISGIEVYLDSFGEDGVCVEGVDYFSYGFGFFVCFADYLKERTQGAIDYFKRDKVKKIALGQQLFYLEEPYTLSFADGSDAGRYRMGLTCYLKEQYHELRVPDRQCAQNILEDSCGRFALSLRDILWYREDGMEQNAQKESVWLMDAQWLISYADTPQDPLTLAVKGGHNAESHNHNDCGSFVLYKEGKPMLIDLGAGLYDRDYFTERRYLNFVPSALSHNIPVIDGHIQQAGEKFAAKRVKASIGKTDYLEAGLEDCYDALVLKSFTRRIEHKKICSSVQLTDCFDLKHKCVIQERFISHLPFVIKGQTASITSEGTLLEIVLQADAQSPTQLPAKLSVTNAEYLDHLGEKKNVWILTADVEMEEGAGDIRVIFN